MRCCASKRSTSTRSEAGGDATPKAGIESGVAARAGAHSISIRVVDSEDESRAPRGWPGGTDPCSSDDGGARTSTSAFAEGCVAVDADAVARSIATELLMTRTSDRRDVFSVRRSGTVSAMDTDVEIDLEAGNGGAVSCGDTVTEPDETTRLLAGAAAAAYSSLPSSSDEDAKSSRHRRDRDERSDLSRATTSTRDYGVNTDLSDDESRGGVHARRRRGRAAVTPVTAVLLTACAVAGCALYSLDPSLSSAASAYRIFTGRMNAAHGDDAGVEIVSAESAAEVLVPTAATTMKAKAAPKKAKMKMKNAKMKHADRRSADDATSARERFAAAFSAALDSDAASASSRTHRTHSSSHHHDEKGKSVREREPAKKSGEASSSSGHHAPSGHHAHAEPAPSGSKHAQLAGFGRSRGGTFERVAGACAANVPNGDVRRGRFQFEDASCAEGAEGADTAVRGGGCARLHRHHSRTHEGSHGSSHADLGCRFCVLHGSQREEDDGDDDDYSPLLDPLAWSVDYVACPRDVCVTHDLRATLCDPDRSVP